MGAAALGIAAVIVSPWPTLALAIPACAATYAGTLRLVAPDLVRDVRRRLAAGMSRAPG
jgi:hypothetical protein